MLTSAPTPSWRHLHRRRRCGLTADGRMCLRRVVSSPHIARTGLNHLDDDYPRAVVAPDLPLLAGGAIDQAGIVITGTLDWRGCPVRGVEKDAGRSREDDEDGQSVARRMRKSDGSARSSGARKGGGRRRRHEGAARGGEKKGLVAARSFLIPDEKEEPKTTPHETLSGWWCLRRRGGWRGRCVRRRSGDWSGTGAASGCPRGRRPFRSVCPGP